jgi:imidazolonepropionase-like amidohydrolase
MLKKYLILLIFQVIVYSASFSQTGVPVNGVSDNYDGIVVFTNGTLIKDYQTKITGATLIIEKGKIIGAGKNIKIPQASKIIDLKGHWIYPSFIDAWSEYGLTKAPKKSESNQPQFQSSKHGPYYWNEAIHPETNASNLFTIQNEEAKSYRSIGFGAVASHQQNGISRGTGVFSMLGSQMDQKQLINPLLGHYFSFNKGNSTQNYPSSLMGSIALLRQFFYDAKWYPSKLTAEVNLSLTAYNNTSLLPHFIETNDVQDLLRADKLGDEFGIQFTIKGSGEEYQFIEEVRNTKAPLIIPLNFPDAYDVEDPLDARLLQLNQLKHWEMAPFNARILYENGIEFSFTSYGLKKKDKFLPNLRKAIENGLPEDYALKALTVNPAKLLKSDLNCGTLDVGKYANFIITDGNIFKDGTNLLENWVQGQQNVLINWNITDFSGTYSLQVADSTYTFKIFGKSWQPKAELIPKHKGEIKITSKNDFIHFEWLIKNKKPLYGIGYKENSNISILLNDSGGKQMSLMAKFMSKLEIPRDSIKKANFTPLPKFAWPWQYSTPSNLSYLISNCTVWTCDKPGILNHTDVIIKGGKITSIGEKLSQADAITIDGTNLHLTPGIIDEHSHIAISKGVNEGTQSITSEVRIEDVINAKDVNIYRQLAGGVTTSHLLHGSANAIGGQTALIKLKYGEAPEKLKFATDHRFIKFALGENVKQSNWGDNQTVRFPQTRMGVEQVFMDGFTRAKAYELTKKTPGYRVDLELEALLEILNKKRFITCHSYVQSEINMLMHVADSFGFKVNTFTHILEGYKVADKMKAHGASASTFADWWAYKYEVVDAIPHNAGIMNEVGVLTGINSDDAEMGRRLNQEAAKSIKYSQTSETDALNMVTINPAKMLHVDHKVGSITIGKDADLVLWSGHPLSNYSSPITTWIEGKIYFDKNEDLQKRTAIASERQRLIHAMILAKKSGQSTQKVSKMSEPEYHCEDEDE